eukprot:361684-Chlamydomonas_euryale.AAC.9
MQSTHSCPGRHDMMQSTHSCPGRHDMMQSTPSGPTAHPRNRQHTLGVNPPGAAWIQSPHPTRPPRTTDAHTDAPVHGSVPLRSSR